MPGLRDQTHRKHRSDVRIGAPRSIHYSGIVQKPRDDVMGQRYRRYRRIGTGWVPNRGHLRNWRGGCHRRQTSRCRCFAFAFRTGRSHPKRNCALGAWNTAAPSALGQRFPRTFLCCTPTRSAPFGVARRSSRRSLCTGRICLACAFIAEPNCLADPPMRHMPACGKSPLPMLETEDYPRLRRCISAKAAGRDLSILPP